MNPLFLEACGRKQYLLPYISAGVPGRRRLAHQDSGHHGAPDPRRASLAGQREAAFSQIRSEGGYS